MEAIKDYKRKWDKLWLFFSMLPKTEIGIKDKGEHKGERYDNKPYKFADQYRKDFDSVLNQAESLFYSCGVDIIELEEEIADNTTKIDVILKSVSDYMKWPQYDPKKSPWLKSLLDAKIISEEEFNCACNHIRFCADTMRDNVQTMKQLLNKYTEQPENDEQNSEEYPQELLALFHNRTELIKELVGKSDDEIADQIKAWGKEKDKFGQPLIENPDNFGNKSLYAKAMKKAGIIHCSVSSFRQNKF